MESAVNRRSKKFLSPLQAESFLTPQRAWTRILLAHLVIYYQPVSSVDVDADEKARLAEQSRSNLDSPHLDANSKASDQLLAQDGKDVNANRQIDKVRDKL